MNQPVRRYGFFGKIISVGDFVSRGLDSVIVHHLDVWLSALQEEAEANDSHVLCPAFIEGAPVFRLFLEEGVLSEHCWAGLLTASCDSVGRQFPLILLHELTGEPELRNTGQADQIWFEDFEDVVHACRSRLLLPDTLQEIIARFVPDSVNGSPGIEGALEAGGGWWWIGLGAKQRFLPALPDLRALTGVLAMYNPIAPVGASL